MVAMSSHLNQAHAITRATSRPVAARRPRRMRRGVQLSIGGSISCLAQQGVDNPAASHMLSGLAAMVQDVGVVATSILQGVCKYSETVVFERPRRKGAIVVGGLGQRQHGWGAPRGVDGDGAEGVAKDVTK